MRPRFDYSVGEVVRIKSGAFQSFTGRIEAVDQDTATLKVMVKIFGRTEPIELGFLDVEKITFTEEE
ncbi:MAG TPA: KOW motif-containing protein [Pyrinomonadaceae bacterium]|nr:KOW motif-containing protein [Pyrinomonadaceae bacterium]